MNRLGFIILSILRQEGATNKLSSMTVREIASAEEFGIKENTICRRAAGMQRVSGEILYIVRKDDTDYGKDNGGDM